MSIIRGGDHPGKEIDCGERVYSFERCFVMNGTRRLIFRSEALRRYAQSRERPILLRLIAPPTFLCLWVLLGLLVMSGIVAWFAQVPVYTSGSAVVVDWKGSSPAIHDAVVLVVFLPAEDLSHLRIGQVLFLKLNPTGERVSRPLIAVEPEIVGPDAAQRQFALSALSARVITGPSAVAIA